MKLPFHNNLSDSKTKLLLLLCMVTAVLSAFLDNVTTILLIAPVTCKLCKLVNIDPRPYLISEAIFSNVGGTSTMIGEEKLLHVRRIVDVS